MNKGFPPEIWGIIHNFLEPSEQAEFRLFCRKFYEISEKQIDLLYSRAIVDTKAEWEICENFIDSYEVDRVLQKSVLRFEKFKDLKERFYESP